MNESEGNGNSVVREDEINTKSIDIRDSAVDAERYYVVRGGHVLTRTSVDVDGAMIYQASAFLHA